MHGEVSAINRRHNMMSHEVVSESAGDAPVSLGCLVVGDELRFVPWAGGGGVERWDSESSLSMSWRLGEGFRVRRGGSKLMVRC